MSEIEKIIEGLEKIKTKPELHFIYKNMPALSKAISILERIRDEKIEKIIDDGNWEKGWGIECGSDLLSKAITNYLLGKEK